MAPVFAERTFRVTQSFIVTGMRRFTSFDAHVTEYSALLNTCEATNGWRSTSAIATQRKDL